MNPTPPNDETLNKKTHNQSSGDNFTDSPDELDELENILTRFILDFNYRQKIKDPRNKKATDEAIQALTAYVTRARIDEVKRMKPGNTNYYKKGRIQELQSQLGEKK